MRFFPIKTAILCLLVTPVLYAFSLSLYEKYLDRSYSDQIQNILIGDSTSLLKGTIRLEEQIAMNIDTFLDQDWKAKKTRLDIKIQVTLTSGRIIYPLFMDIGALEKNFETEFNNEEVAKNNFDMLNSGFKISVKTRIKHGSFLSNIILALYSGLSLFVFFMIYKAASQKADKDIQEKRNLISDLKKDEASYKEILAELKNERQGLFENIKLLNSKYQENKRKTKVNEEEMFEEIISLEEQIQSFIDLKNKKENEISDLKSKVRKYERRKSSKSKRNEFDFIEKRFCALYKNLDMERKAITGFLNLNEDQQIKAEEMILQMNFKPDAVIIKRKVFSGKKHRTACFEVLFAYNGRLYFRKNKNNRIQVVVIGTKNTQSKDMELLHNL